MGVTTCPNCHEAVDESSDICMNCGYRLSEVEDATTVQSDAPAIGYIPAGVVRHQPLVPITSSPSGSSGAVRMEPLVPITHETSKRVKPLIENEIKKTGATTVNAIKLKPLDNIEVTNVNVDGTVVFGDGNEQANDETPRVSAKLVSIRDVEDPSNVTSQSVDAGHDAPVKTLQEQSAQEPKPEVVRPKETTPEPVRNTPYLDTKEVVSVGEEDPDAPTMVFEEERRVRLLRRNTGEELSGILPFSIGKGTKASVMVAGNRFISREHALFFQRDDNVYIKDNNSLNGTFVNDRQLEKGGESQIVPGMVIRLVNEEFEYLVD